jgi:endoribonuclease Dicer
MEQAKSENLIVCLPTGSGKTFIAVMLIKELSPITRRSLKDNGKRTIVLVKTGIINLAFIVDKIFLLLS